MNESPLRQRSQIGIANDPNSPITAIEVTAKKATADQIAGRAITIAAAPSANAAFDGLRFLSIFTHIAWPGTARSREKAKSIREPAVTQDIPQKN